MAEIFRLQLKNNKEEVSYSTPPKLLLFKRTYRASQFPKLYSFTNNTQSSIHPRAKSRQERTHPRLHSKSKHESIFASFHYQEFFQLKYLGKKCLACKKLKCICY